MSLFDVVSLKMAGIVGLAGYSMLLVYGAASFHFQPYACFVMGFWILGIVLSAGILLENRNEQSKRTRSVEVAKRGKEFRRDTGD